MHLRRDLRDPKNNHRAVMQRMTRLNPNDVDVVSCGCGRHAITTPWSLPLIHAKDYNDSRFSKMMALRWNACVANWAATMPSACFSLIGEKRANAPDRRL